jgi:Putative inner membrane exporter, YdcZ
MLRIAAPSGLTITADILMSLAIDRFGLFGVQQHSIGPGRAIGARTELLRLAVAEALDENADYTAPVCNESREVPNCIGAFVHVESEGAKSGPPEANTLPTANGNARPLRPERRAARPE